MTTQTQTQYSFLGLRPRRRSDAAVVRDCVDCVCGARSATFARGKSDGRWQLTPEIEHRDLICERATAAAVRGVLARVARGADSVALARAFAGAVARAARLNAADGAAAAAAHAVAEACASYVEDAETLALRWRDADRVTLIAVDRAWAPLFRRGLVLAHVITAARGGGVSLDVGPLELGAVARRAAAALRTACLARGLSGGDDAAALASAFAKCAEPLAAAKFVLGPAADTPASPKTFSIGRRAPSTAPARIRVDAWRADLRSGGDPFFVACAAPEAPPLPPPILPPPPPPPPPPTIYDAPPRFLSTKPTVECDSIRDLVRLERDEQLQKLVAALGDACSVEERRFVQNGNEYWAHAATASAAPPVVDARPEPRQALYALPGFLDAGADARADFRIDFDGLVVADALRKAHARSFDDAPLRDDDVSQILQRYGGSFDAAVMFCGTCDRAYRKVTAFRGAFARTRRRRPAQALDVALHACEHVARVVRDHCRRSLADALLDARVRAGGAADEGACRNALERYVSAEDAPSLAVAALHGTLHETVGAPLLKALDAAEQACAEGLDGDVRLDHFHRLKLLVGAAREALGAALVADPRTPSLHALRVALDWDGRFFAPASSRSRARLSPGI